MCCAISRHTARFAEASNATDLPDGQISELPVQPSSKKFSAFAVANEAELHSLYQTADFDTALTQLRSDAKLAAGTRSEKGCVVAAKDGVTAVPAFPIDRIVDTTGAGDLFAAGFLFGLVRNAGFEAAGRLGRSRRLK